MQITIVGPNLSGKHQRIAQFHVHKTGCADLRRTFSIYELDEATEASAVRQLDAVAFIYGPEAGGFYEESGGDAEWGNLDKMLTAYSSDFHFARCVKELK